ncbi:MAG: peroxiredoxin [Methylococcales bacterium]
MTSITIGTVVPDFEALSTGDKTIKLSELQSHFVLLYFYPKDSTPGCTLEGQSFRDHIEKFHTLNTIILGISRDTLRSHENFKCKQAFPFDLLADENEVLCQLFDVIKMKNMYGKQVRGIERSTFLINQEGILVKEWRKVKVKGHTEEILAYLGGGN